MDSRKSNLSQPSLVGPNGFPLRIVVVDCPYDTLADPLTQKLIGKIAAFKIEGYQKEYGYGVMPVDTGDFVAAHMLLCEQNGDDYAPIVGMKSLNLTRCNIHEMEFPALHLGIKAEFGDHRKAVEEYLRLASQKNEQVAYNASWTIHPHARVNKTLVKLCRDITVAFFVNYYSLANIKHIITAATLKFKADEFIKFIGFRPLELNGKPLSKFFYPHALINTDVLLMVLDDFTPEAIELAKRFQVIWGNRLQIGHSNISLGSTVKKKAA